MQKVSIQTPQNVTIDLPLASVGERILASLLDWALFIAWIFISSTVLSELGVYENWVFFLIIALPVMTYHFLAEVFFQGQSIGKHVARIRVVRLDGAQPTPYHYLARWLLRLLDITFIFNFPVVGIMSIILSSRGQRVGDIAAGTVVVKIIRNLSIPSHKLLLSLNDDYEPQYPQAVKLSDQEVDVIRKALAAFRSTRNRTPVEMAAAKVSQFLGVEIQGTDVDFLTQILKDHGFLTSQQP